MFFLTLLTAFQLVASIAPAQMRQIFKDETRPENEIRGIDFYSPTSGYVAFNDWIGFTTDTGRTFTRKYISTGNVDYAGNPVNLTFGFYNAGVKAFDQNTLLTYGHYGFENTILRSTDGGNSYRVVFYKGYNPNVQSDGIKDMSFVPGGTTGFAVDEGSILKTTNGGQSWTSVRNESGGYFNHVQAIDANNAYVLSTSDGTQDGTNRLYKTTNGGSNWQVVTFPAGGGTLYGASFLTASKGWISMSGGFYLTLNGGATWTKQNHPATLFGSGTFIFVDDNTGYALGPWFALFKTTDAGKIWEPLPRDNDFSYLGYGLNALFSYSNSQLWAGGIHGFLELSTNGGGAPLPKAFSSIDTTGLSATGIVKLFNHSKTGYSFRWLKNDTLIGTTYDLSFTRGQLAYPLRDTFKLVASDGTHTDTAVLYQDYNEPAYISSFSPVVAPAGTTITISGAHFTGTTAVLFGGTPATTFSVVNANTITAVIGAGASGTVSVVTPGRGTATLGGFTFLPPPIITSFTPTAAAAGSTITITGNYFTGATAVRIGNKAATSYTVVSPTTITAVVPSGTSGSIKITTNAGNVEQSGFLAIPTPASFSPASGTHGTVMKIKGTSLFEVTGVTIGGIPVQSFTVLSEDSLSAVVGTGATGAVAVTAPGGSSSLPGFTWHAPPAITSFTPLSAAPGTAITITGTNFSPVASQNVVLFGTVHATVTAASATSLTVTAPAGATLENISVSTNGLTAYSARQFQSSFTGGGAITSSSFTRTDINTEYPGGGGGRAYWDKAVGDLDGDGKQDLMITTSYFGSSADILLNTSTGNTPSFATAQNFYLYGSSTTIADLDGDGKSDIIREYGGLQIDRNTSTPGNLSFEQTPSYNIGITPFQNIAVNDVDKDGKADIVLASGSDMIVLRNTGVPGALAFDTAMLRYGGYDLTLADIDLDGRPDIIQFNPNTGSITIYRNNSTPANVSFTQTATLTANTPYAVVAGDIDGDGKPDIIAGSRDGNKIEVFRNTSAGSISFAGAVPYTMPGTTYDIALADLDGNGKLDIITSTNAYHFVTFKNISTEGSVNIEAAVGHFPGTFNSSGSFRYRLAMADFNANGKPGPVLIDQIVRARLSVYTNNVSGIPHVREFTPTTAAANTLVTIKGAQFTGATAVSFGGVPASSFTILNDTSIEARVGTGATGQVSVTNQLGTGSKDGFLFGSLPVITSYTPATGPVGSQVTITGTGFNPAPQDNIVYLGGVRATVAAATSTSLTIVVPAGAAPGSITVTANNRTASTGKNFNVTFPGTGEEFSDTSFIAGFPGPGIPIAAIADLDQDGKNDMIGWRDGISLSVARNTSTPGTASYASVVDFEPAETSIKAAAGDIDGDGKIDVVVASAVSNKFYIFRNTTTSVGNISFAEKLTYAIETYQLPGNGIAIGDLDGDGRPEIIVSSSQANRLYVFRNTSSPGIITLAQPVETGYNGSPWGVSTANMDDDSRLEIVSQGTSYSYSGPVAVLKNTGATGELVFTVAGQASPHFANRSLDLADLDMDGKTDIITSSDNGRNVDINRNTSTGGTIQFSGINMSFPENEYHPITRVGDLNGDGKPDILLTTSGNYILKNNSTPGTIALAPRMAWPFGATTFADVDGDGALDMIGTSTSLNRMGRNVLVRLCQNADTLLDAGGSGATYQWQQNTGTGFVNVQDGVHFAGSTTSKLQLHDVPASWNNYQFRCMVNGTPNARVYVLAIEAGNQVPSVTIDTPTKDTICTGTAITFTATPVNGGTNPSYQWQVNGVNAGLNANAFTTTELTDGTQVTVIMTSSSGCVTPATATSNTINVPVSSSLTPSITLVASDMAPCAGEMVTVKAIAINGGTNPFFAWLRNGNVSSSGDNDSTLTFSSLPVDSHTVKVIAVLRSRLSCASTYDYLYSKELPITFYGTGNAEVSITASATTICPGTMVTFTAKPVRGGSTPAYQWNVNGVNVGENTATFSSNTLTDGDQVTVEMTGNAPCAATSTATSNAITITTGAAITPAVTIAASATTICAGAAITFTATPTNAGNTPGYKWLVNGVEVAGQQGVTFVSTTLADNDEVSVVLTSALPCIATPEVTSNIIKVTVKPKVTPTIAITAPTTEICAGGSITFTATSEHGGTAPLYEWRLNDAHMQHNSTTFTPANLKNGDNVVAYVVSNAECRTQDLSFSNFIYVTVNTSVTPTVSIAASATSICTGANVIFTATAANAGSTPAYQWQVNGVNVGTSAATFSSSNLANGDIVNVILTSDLSCATSNTATSNTIAMVVNAGAAPSVSIAASSTNICSGTNVIFTATPVNGGSTPAYQWQVNGANVGQNAATFSSNSLANDDVVRVIITNSNASCATSSATSNAITMAVSAGITPSVNIVASATSICAGTNVTFTATPVNGGSTPAYQWQVNGANVGINAATFSSSNLANNDVVKVILTINGMSCATSNTATSNAITMAVSAGTAASVSIAASSTNICAGTNVTFTATPVNGGSTPAYQWQVNGINAGLNSATYSSSTLTNGAQVRVVMTANGACIASTPVNSNVVAVAVNSPVAPTVAISGNTTVEQNNSTLINTTVNHAGSAPAYQWQDSTATHSWQNIPGATGSSINYTPEAAGDKLRCRLTSNSQCISTTTALSNTLTFELTNPAGGRVAPNPVQDMLHIDMLSLDDQWETMEIASASGGNKLIVRNVVGQTSVNIPVGQLAKGLYIAVFKSKTGATMKVRFLKI